jgi:hypothetical protein
MRRAPRPAALEPAGAARLRSPVSISVNNYGVRTRRGRINNTRKNNSSKFTHSLSSEAAYRPCCRSDAGCDPEATMIIAIVLLSVSTVIAVAAVALWLDAPAAAMGDRAIDD